MPSDSRCRHRWDAVACCCLLLPAVVLAIVMPAIIVRLSFMPCLVIYSGGRSLYCHASSCIVIYTAVLAAVLAFLAMLSLSSTGHYSLYTVAVDKLLPCCSNTTPKSSHFSQVFHSHFSRRNRKLEDGHLIEGGNVGIRGSSSGDKGPDSL